MTILSKSRSPLNVVNSSWTISMRRCFCLKFSNFGTIFAYRRNTIAFDDTPQIIVRRCQIAAPKWPNNISSAEIMRSSKTGRKISSVALAVRHLALSCWNQMLPISSSSIFANKIRLTWPDSDRHWLQRPFLTHFRRKMAQLCRWTKILYKQWLVLGASAFKCMCVGFLCPKCDNFTCLHTRQDQNRLHLKRWFFFCQIGIFCKSIAGPLPRVV